MTLLPQQSSGMSLHDQLRDVERRSTPEAVQRMMSDLLDIVDALPEVPTLPTDFAAQHDHYIHGTPKRPTR